MKEGIYLSVMCFMFSLPLAAEQSDAATNTGLQSEYAIADTQMEFEMDYLEDSPRDESGYFSSLILQPARFTLKHELSNQITSPHDFTSNRSSFRIEYEKYFLGNFYIQFDSKLTAFWNTDHRAQAEDENVYFETTSRDAYIQFSKGETSIKVGTQILIWGESDGGAITDVISPRNLSELFFISIEESRIGQPMINLDHFSDLGRWSLFYIPDPEFNEYPEEGTAYYLDPFNGLAEYRNEDSDKDLSEYGFSWKKTFGRSDIGLMAASLIDNDFAYRQTGNTPEGKIILERTKPRFDMAGITFNYAQGNYLFSGEIARKTPKVFNDAELQLLERDIVDAALRTEYSLGKGGGHSVSLEVVSNHVDDWSADIVATPKDRNSLIFGWNNHFFNEDLTVNLISIYNKPYTSYQHSLFMTYKWNNHITLNLDAFYLSVKDERSDLYPYRDKSNVILKILYQF